MSPIWNCSPENRVKKLPPYAKNFPTLNLTIRGYTWVFHLCWNTYCAIATMESMRKMFKEMFRAPDLNREVYKALVAWFPAAETAAHEAWKAASQEYVNGWKDANFAEKSGAKPSAVHAINANNKKLETNLKRAKAFYERTVKLKSLFFESLNENCPTGWLSE